MPSLYTHVVWVGAVSNFDESANRRSERMASGTHTRALGTPPAQTRTYDEVRAVQIVNKLAPIIIDFSSDPERALRLRLSGEGQGDQSEDD